MKRRMLAIIWFLGCFSFAASAFGEIPENLFFEANQHYANGEFQEAVRRYEEVINTGVQSGALYYNLGNAYFKVGQRGKALAHYERARKFIPQDEDLFANISFVTSLFEEAQPEDIKSWIAKWYEGMRDSFSSSGWFKWILAIYWLGSILIGITIFRENSRRWMFIVSFFLLFALVGAGVFCWTRASVEKHSGIGVVISPEVEVRYSPSFSGEVAFRLHEGIKAQMVRRDGDWTQIRLTQAKSGWVETSAVEEI